MRRFLTKILAAAICGLSLAAAAPTRQPQFVGIDSNYALDMTQHHKVWKDARDPASLYALFSHHGCHDARIRLWVGDAGVNQLAYATKTAELAQHAGLKPYLVLFLSDNWADMVKQPVPSAWKNLAPADKLAAVHGYARTAVKHMLTAGLDIDTFEIGNEIDFGICGDFEEAWPNRVSLDSMRARIWPGEAAILKAAQAGVLASQPKAKFILHLAQWNNVDYCIAFWRFMRAAGIRFDYAGLSYYPSSAEKPEQRSFDFLRAQAAKIMSAVHRPTILCETAYPAAANFAGQFATWNHAAAGYPLTEAGQAKWLADLLSMTRTAPDFAGVFYWSPEWYPGRLWDAFALFNPTGKSRPAIRAFAP